MTGALAVALLLAAPPPAEVRDLTVTFTDTEGTPVEGLGPEEMVVLENGVAREVTRAEVDRRPLTLALVLDDSEAVGSAFRLSVVDAVEAFLAGLPDGARVTIWATGDRATRVAGPSTDRAEATRSVQRLFPHGANTLLDTLVQACRELEAPEGQRSAVVAVTGTGPEASFRDRQRALSEARGCADVFMAVQFGGIEGSFEDRLRYDYVLEGLTRETGGLYERPLSSLGLSDQLATVATALKAPYRVSYATLPEIKQRKLEITVARPGIAARVWPEKRP